MIKKAIPDNLGDQFFEGKSVFFEKNTDDVKAHTQQETKPKQVIVNKETKQSSSNEIKNTVDQSINRPVNSSVDDFIALSKPKGFYITEKQDEELDVAVKLLTDKMKGKITAKIDRSTVLRLILDSAQITDEATITKLTGQLTNQLIKQLTG